MSYDYEIYGLAVKSDVLLAEAGPPLPPGPAPRKPEVEVREGRVPPFLAGTIPNADGYFVAGDQIFFAVPHVARFLARGGRELIVHPFAGADDGSVRLHLLGSGLAAIMHQRGLWPLHASAVAYEGRCIAFTGHSGAGKSTMATQLAQRGFPIVSDDILILSRAPDGPGIVATPGIPIVKLWPDSARLYGFLEAQASFETENYAKAHYFTAPVGESIPLGRIYLLRWMSPPESAPEIVPHRGLDAIHLLKANIFRPSLIESLGRGAAFFELAQRVLRQADTVEVRRGMRFEAAGEHVGLIERHIRQTGGDIQAGTSRPEPLGGAGH